MSQPTPTALSAEELDRLERLNGPGYFGTEADKASKAWPSEMQSGVTRLIAQARRASDPTPTDTSASGAEGLSLADLRVANIKRQDEWKLGGDTGPVGGLYRANELGGETGEALNVVKKLEREARGWRGSRATVQELADEIADVVICADLLAAEYQIDLGAAVVAKFNATSEKVGLPSRLAPTPALTDREEVERMLRTALAAWDRYQPDATRAEIVRQANAMAQAIRAALQSAGVE